MTVTGSNIASTAGFTSNVTNTSNLNNATVSSSGSVGLTTKDLILQTAVITTSGGITENASGNITQDNSRTIATNTITINANSLNIILTSSLKNAGTSSVIATSNAIFTAVSGTNSVNSYIASGGTLGVYADTLITNGGNAQMWSVGNLTLAGYGNASIATFNNGSTTGSVHLQSQASMQIYANKINNIRNAPLTEGNARTLATVGYGGSSAIDTRKLMPQEVATNILTSTNLLITLKKTTLHQEKVVPSRIWRLSCNRQCAKKLQQIF